jgi:hypothetical protein
MMSTSVTAISNPVSIPSTRRVRASSSSDSSTPKQKQTKSPRKTSSLPSETVEYLKNWMMSPEHIAHPYPTEQEKVEIMAETGIELRQLTNWFVNNRKRFWKPRVEARLQHQALDQFATVPHVSPSKSDLKSVTAPHIALDMTTQQSRLVSVTSFDDANMHESDNFHVFNSDSLATYDRSGSPRAVSIGSDSMSESDNSSSSEMDDEFYTGDLVDEVDTESQTVKLRFMGETAASVAGLPTSSKPPQEVTRKRPSSTEADEAYTHRPKFLRKCTSTWRDACRVAADGYDRELPSLEEASHLFGYAKQ